MEPIDFPLWFVTCPDGPLRLEGEFDGGTREKAILLYRDMQAAHAMVNHLGPSMGDNVAAVSVHHHQDLASVIARAKRLGATWYWFDCPPDAKGGRTGKLGFLEGQLNLHDGRN